MFGKKGLVELRGVLLELLNQPERVFGKLLTVVMCGGVAIVAIANQRSSSSVVSSPCNAACRSTSSYTSSSTCFGAPVYYMSTFRSSFPVVSSVSSKLFTTALRITL